MAKTEGIPILNLPRRLGGLTGTARQATRESRLASFGVGGSGRLGHLFPGDDAAKDLADLMA